MDTPILGLDIGGTKTAVVLGDRAGRIHERVEFATHTERGFYTVFADLCEHAEQVRTQATQAGRPPK